MLLTPGAANPYLPQSFHFGAEVTASSGAKAVGARIVGLPDFVSSTGRQVQFVGKAVRESHCRNRTVGFVVPTTATLAPGVAVDCDAAERGGSNGSSRYG